MEKSCIFYASKYHLSLILLEYLKDSDTKKYTVSTFFENEIKDEINLLSSKYKIEIPNEINFDNTKEIAKQKIKPNENMIFIIEGEKNYMKEANEYIKKTINKQNFNSVKIVNCFNYEQQRENIESILEENDKILFTSGAKTID